MKSEEKKEISADTILLDVVSHWPATEAVIKKYDEKAGVCLCCSCLFDTVGDVAARFALDGDMFLSDLKKAIG
ncbi:hypothetical protein ASZ90_005844 [hydrocarbon metagenome]|jgi:hypothetical protein|uniref:DUF1858 domain-containing protein n=1 Tax=hydrocarbon metagenome TaxID=938273 RepID=A0A0W8FU27_9ZZZZ